MESTNTTTRWYKHGGIQIPLYVIIFLLAVIGNTLVILTLIHNRRMRTVTNLFLLNLAVSDLLLGVLCMPFTLIGALLRDFVFGEIMCRLLPFLQACSVCVGVWTLVAISVERYYAICHPLRSLRWQTVSHAYKSITIIWLGSFACMTPIALLSTLKPTRQGNHKCRESWPTPAYERAYNLFLDVVLLVIPLVVMAVTYSLITRTLCRGTKMEKALKNRRDEAFLKSSNDSTVVSIDETRKQITLRHTNAERSLVNKKRVVKMLLAVVLEFFICWTPLYVINTLVLFDSSIVYDNLGYKTVSFLQLLAYTSSCCNPITYCFMNCGFRKSFLNLFGCLKKSMGRRKNHVNVLMK